MERNFINELVRWKNKPDRKPLIVKGIRQVGKTWILNEFGKRYYKKTVYITLEDPEIRPFFESSRDPKKVFQNLEVYLGQPIEPNTTLIFLDEIQESSGALNLLKYINEKNNEYHVVCAGSLLGIALAGPFGFPVGKVDYLELHPLSFLEFLQATGKENLANYIESMNTIEEIPFPFFKDLSDLFKIYLVTGGMPEAINRWIESHDLSKVDQTLGSILDSYQDDFSKHPKDHVTKRIRLIWNSLPSQLAKENKKFLYSAVKNGARAREYEEALQWLADAGVIYKIFRSKAPRLPLSAYDDLTAFKVYLPDVGLLRRFAKLPHEAVTKENNIFTEFKGSLAENYILQTLDNNFEVLPRYWSQNNPSYEVDFLIQKGQDIFPIEVKSGKNVISKSLKNYKRIFSEETKLRIRFSSNNLRLDEDVLNVPLFLADHLPALIDIALQEIQFKNPQDGKV